MKNEIISSWKNRITSWTSKSNSELLFTDGTRSWAVDCVSFGEITAYGVDGCRTKDDGEFVSRAKYVVSVGSIKPMDVNKWSSEKAAEFMESIAASENK